MTFTRWVALGAGVAFLATVPGEAARAQGATTGAITGLVTDAAGKPLENAQVQVVNRSTGFTTGQQTRANGRYYVQNLEVGPNYAVTVRLIGYTPVTQQPVRVTLTQATRVDVQLAQSATQLTAVTVTADAARSADFSPTRQGVQTTVSDTLIRRIPNLDRNFTSLVRLTPQVTSQTGGFSAAGSNPRLSQFTIDGANQTDRFGLNSSDGQPGGGAGGRIVPIDAIKEVQVQLTPTDVRLGNFASVLVNAVTRSGTNDLTGGLNYTFRNPASPATRRSCARATCGRRSTAASSAGRSCATGCTSSRRSSCRPGRTRAAASASRRSPAGPPTSPRGRPRATRRARRSSG
jgi:hypothetical protein